MKRTIRRYKLGYVLGGTLCLIGFASTLFMVWKAWPQISSNPDPLSYLWAFLWEEQLSLVTGVELKLAYFAILAAIMLIAGAIVLMYSRQWFFLPERTMTLRCPFCKKQWLASYDRGQVLCPHCHHLVHPKMVDA
ncbi:hypothetical protein GTO27_02000 [Candidatus Bathyarchaeota archaeon]|nr:hypothetical protein [Candidatus Bathyarchaeota archaeon]